MPAQVLETVMKTWWPWSWAGQSEGPHALVSLECTVCPQCSQWEPFQGRSLERTMCCWGHLDSMCDCAPLRPLYKLLRFRGWRVCRSLLVLQPPSLVGKFPCLLNLTPAILELFASFFSLSLPSVCVFGGWGGSGGSFEFHPRESSQGCKP